MISLVPLARIMSAVAMVYSVFVVIAVILFSAGNISYSEGVSAAMGGGTALTLLLLGFFYVGWRWLWRMFPSLNRLLFPDLNGVWDVHIRWVRGAECGAVEAVAYVSQTLLNISIHVQSPDSESDTLAAVPKKDPESGRPTLYYVYRNTPKRSIGGRTTYDGSAILKIDHEDVGVLAGNYFTDRASQGHFTFAKRMC